MNRLTHCLLIAGLTLSCVASAQPFSAKNNTPARQVDERELFTHLRSIPSDADPATIRLERVKAVSVAGKTAYRERTAPESPEQQFRDPGGTQSWPTAESVPHLPAYEVTFSYSGQPLSSDESGSKYSTFTVYFHPEELPAELRNTLTFGKSSRSTLATYFKVTAVREPRRRSVIDQASSKFCDGNYVDGAWIRSNSRCNDQISVTAQTVLADSTTLSVSVVSPATVATK